MTTTVLFKNNPNLKKLQDAWKNEPDPSKSKELYDRFYDLYLEELKLALANQPCGDICASLVCRAEHIDEDTWRDLLAEALLKKGMSEEERISTQEFFAKMKPEHQAQFPEDVRMGRRDMLPCEKGTLDSIIREEEAEKYPEVVWWSAWTPKKKEGLAAIISRLRPEERAKLPEDMVSLEREWTTNEHIQFLWFLDEVKKYRDYERSKLPPLDDSQRMAELPPLKG